MLYIFPSESFPPSTKMCHFGEPTGHIGPIEDRSGLSVFPKGTHNPQGERPIQISTIHTAYLPQEKALRRFGEQEIQKEEKLLDEQTVQVLPWRGGQEVSKKLIQ